MTTSPEGLNPIPAMWRFLRIAALCGVLLAGFGGRPVAAEAPDLVMEEVTFLTEDKAEISASWIRSLGVESDSGRRPAVILLHDYGLDRRDWGVFIPQLVEHGMHVLALDLRGHGQSINAGTRQAGGYSFGTSSVFLSNGLLDVDGAVTWLRKRDDVNAKAISLVGVGAGGDLAYAAARSLGRRIVKATVVISPSPTALTNGNFVSDDPARAVLFCAATGDANGSSMMAAESLANFTDSPKKVVVYNSQAHGFSMFYKHPEISQEILSWLSR